MLNIFAIKMNGLIFLSQSSQAVKEAANQLFKVGVDYSHPINWLDKQTIYPLIYHLQKYVEVWRLTLPWLQSIGLGYSVEDIWRQSNFNNVVELYNLQTSRSVMGLIRTPILDTNTSLKVIDGVSVYEINIKKQPIIFFIHGGGLISVQAYAYINSLEIFAKELNMGIIAIDFISNGNLHSIAEECMRVIHNYPLNNNIYLMGDSSGFTIINRLLFLFNQENINPTYNFHIIYLYPAILEEQGISPGRFASCTYPTLVNLIFLDQYFKHLILDETEYAHLTRYKANNYILIGCEIDPFIDDYNYLCNLLNAPNLILPEAHGFLTLASKDRIKEIADFVLKYLKIEQV